MKRQVLLLLSIFLINSSLLIAQSITNVEAFQMENLIVINYTLDNNENSDIRLYYSEDGGIKFNKIENNLTGDFGEWIEPGKKSIKWNILNEKDYLISNSIVFRVSGNNSKIGKFIDPRDKKVYKTVTIGTQEWMAENLNYYTSNSNSYNYKTENAKKYGQLYNYSTAKDACPDQWHLPEKEEWLKLIEFLGGKYRAAFELQHKITGFYALKGGCKDKDKGFKWIEDWGLWWTNTKYNLTNANSIMMGGGILQEITSVYSSNQDKLSVRCIRDISTSKNEKKYFLSISNPITVAIIKEDLPSYKLPIEFFVKKYVEQKISEWQTKSEFEKTTDYQKRVNETTRNIKIQEFTDEAINEMKKEYTKSINWNNFTLSQYDADNETYLIQSGEFGQFAIPVPASYAQSFKQNWSTLNFIEQDYYVNSNKFILAKLVITDANNGKKYIYDSKQPTTYAANNITYTFKPIEIKVQQDNIVDNIKLTENKTVVGVAEVDINIPLNPQINDKTFVVIIANENYQKEVKVQFAANDGKVFKEYCEKTIGVPSRNIHFVQDATFGNMKSELKWINEVAQAFNGQAKLIFYYAGHGMPNESDRSAYLLPVDGFSTDYGTAIKLEELYSNLNQHPTKNVTVFLDACFSGSVRDNGMLSSARGVKVKPRFDLLKGKTIVFSAATGDETAYPYKEKQHGLFTYFLLKKLQETKGDVDYQTLSNFVIEKVKQQSIVINQKSQTPQVIFSPEIQDSWQIMKIK